MCRSERDPDGPRTCSAHSRSQFSPVQQEMASLDAQIRALKTQIAAAESLEASTEPTIEQLEAAGYAAAADSRSASPALDPLVRRALRNNEVADPRNIPAMEAFQRGYQARVDSELAALVGGGDADRGVPPQPERSASLMEATARTDVAGGHSLMGEYSAAYADRESQSAVHSYREQEVNEAQMLMRTRGAKAGTTESVDALDRAHAEAMASPDAWDSPALVRSRNVYGPGSAHANDPRVVLAPSSADDRALRNSENDLFYAQQQFPDQARMNATQLANIRAEMNSRGIGPKAL